MRPDQTKNSMKALHQPASTDLDHRVHSGIDRELAQTTQNRTTQFEPFSRRQLMKRPVIKIAAAAIIVFAVILGLNPFGKGNITFADVIQPILNARTVALDFISGDEDTGVVMHDIMVGNRIRRTVSNIDTLMILDLDSERMLNLDPEAKEAAYINIQGTMATGTRQCMELVRNIVSKVEDNPELVVKDLGRKDFDGIEAVGFQVKEPGVTVNIWADPVTATPKRIELIIGPNVNVFKNIEFDVLVTEDEISMEVPEGYTLSAQPMDLGEPTEEDLIFMLEIWAKDVLGGTFPDQVGVQELMQLLPTISSIQHDTEPSEEEKAQGGMHFARSMMFLQLNIQRGDFHYAGKGVSFGDSKTAVIWYRPDGAKTYRVIYGDLHVEEVALDLLPQ
jgi:hypothetical protein